MRTSNSLFRAVRRYIAFASAVLVVAAASAGPVRAQTCNVDLCTEPLTSTIYLNNNEYGNRNPVYGSQSITVNSPTSWSTSWSYSGAPINYNIRSYGSAVLGWQYGFLDSGTGLPVALSSHTPVNSVSAYTVSGSTQWMDVAYDCWFHTTNNPPSSGGQSDEMMIWLADYGSLDPGTPSAVSNITIDGIAWDAYHGTAGSWNYVAWHPHGQTSWDLHGATLNITDFTDAAVNNGLIDGSHYLTSVQFGTEIYNNGSGTLNVTNYTASVGGGGSAPPAPTGLTATAGNAQVSLTWNSSSGATSYNVLRSTVSGSGYATVSSPTTTSYTNTGLTNGTTYYFVVTAANSHGTSGNSNQASATPSSGGGGDTAPYNFESSAQGWASNGIIGVTQSTARAYAGTGSLDLHFNGAAGSSDAYVQSSPGAPAGSTITYHLWVPSGSQITSVQPSVADHNWVYTNGTSVPIGSLTTNAWNTVTMVVPSGAAMPLNWLGMHFVTGGTWTGDAYLDTIGWGTGGAAPAAPTGLTATPGNAQVALSWTASSGATSYNVLRSTVNGSGYASVATGISSTSYTNTGLTNGTTYYFVVTATNSSGTSGNSNQASATPSAGAPPAPTGLAATAGNAQVSLTWNSSSGATSYNVLRSTVNGSGYAQVTNVTATSYTNTGLTNGTAYYFVVQAVSSGGTSGNSNQASATPSGGGTVQYDFETGMQGWASSGIITATQSTAQHYTGTHSLDLHFNGAAGSSDAYVQNNPGAPAGGTITYHVWIPSGSQITSVQPSVADHNWVYTNGTSVPIGSLTTNAWNTVTYTVPSNAAMPLNWLGMHFVTGGTWTGDAYLDSISW